jgi:OOP family OmpA-OmpF porin
MNTRSLAVLILTLFFVSGCSTIQSNRPLCIATGAVIGGGGTAIAEDDYALAGAAVGALVAWFVCQPDADGDGVNDDADRCPGTPAGVSVEPNGCPADSDGDGVYDYLDKCPGTRAGVAVDSDGCPRDRDGDGVPDHRDTCPNSPAGSAVDERGCAPDADMDGIPDSSDQCPGTARGKAVDSKGCHITLSLTGLNFGTDSAEFDAQAREQLDEAVSVLKLSPEMRVRVEGHTDSRGSESHNQRLSEKRANAVMQYLIGQGINAGRLESRGYGESSPIASNDTAEGQARNRRVDFAVVER